jgi:hypothetical protein
MIENTAANGGGANVVNGFVSPSPWSPFVVDFIVVVVDAVDGEVVLVVVDTVLVLFCTRSRDLRCCRLVVSVSL